MSPWPLSDFPTQLIAGYLESRAFGKLVCVSRKTYHALAPIYPVSYDCHVGDTVAPPRAHQLDCRGLQNMEWLIAQPVFLSAKEIVVRGDCSIYQATSIKKPPPGLTLVIDGLEHGCHPEWSKMLEKMEQPWTRAVLRTCIAFPRSYGEEFVKRGGIWEVDPRFYNDDGWPDVDYDSLDMTQVTHFVVSDDAGFMTQERCEQNAKLLAKCRKLQVLEVCSWWPNIHIALTLDEPLVKLFIQYRWDDAVLHVALNKSLENTRCTTIGRVGFSVPWMSGNSFPATCNMITTLHSCNKWSVTTDNDMGHIVVQVRGRGLTHGWATKHLTVHPCTRDLETKLAILDMDLW